MIYKNIKIIFLIAALLLLNITIGKAKIEHKKIVKIYDISKINKLNLDIIEYNKKYLLAVISKKDEEKLINENISYEIIIEDTFLFYKKRVKNINDYHNQKELYDDLITLTNSNIAKLFSIGKSAEGRDIWALKLSANPDISDPVKPDIFIIALLHAREWITMEVAYNFAKYIIDNRENTDIKQLIETKEIWILPIANPDGFQYSIDSDRLWRKNRKDNGNDTTGIDLNRNFDFQFGIGGTEDTESEVYQGMNAFSESETIAIAELLSDKEAGGVIDLHSFGQYVLYPWGYTTSRSIHENFFNDLSIKFVNLITESTGNLFDFGQPPEKLPLNGGVGGSLLDYAYEKYDIPTFVIELAPKTFDEGGFELDYEQVNNAFNDVKDLLLYFVKISEPDYFTGVTVSGGCGFIN